MKIYVIDNGGQWTHREWRVLRDLGVTAEIKRNDSDMEELLDADGLVLSGGAASIAYESFKLGRTSEYLSKMKIPILGICVGAQFMGMYYGAKVGPADHPEFGKVRVSVFNKGQLLQNIPDEFFVWESHNDEVKEVPPNFILGASSDTCRLQYFYDDNRKRYAVQFHPEVEHTQYGTQIFKNFIELCAP